MILFVGLAPTTTEQRGAFQEIDLEGLFSPVAKWVGVVRETARIPEFVARVRHRRRRPARPGRARPARERAVGRSAPGSRGPAATARGAAGDEDVSGSRPRSRRRAAAHDRRRAGVVGQDGGRRRGVRDALRHAGRRGVPLPGLLRQPACCYIGHAGLTTEPELAAAIRDADLVIALGTRLDEITTGGYALLEGKGRRPRLIHVSPDAGGLGRFHAEVPIVATSESFAVRLAALPAPRTPWAALRRDLRAAFERWRTPLPGPGEVQLGEVVRALSETLPDDAIVTNGAGNFAAFVHRHFCYKRHGTQLAPASGSMGYGLPAAVAAKLARPDRVVVAVAGDGCFMMTAQELATAVQYGSPSSSSSSTTACTARSACTRTRLPRPRVGTGSSIPISRARAQLRRRGRDRGANRRVRTRIGTRARGGSARAHPREGRRGGDRTRAEPRIGKPPWRREAAFAQR